MKKIMFLCLVSFSIYGCYSDCIPQDVKVGEVVLMPNSKTFITNFENKTAIFKDSLGNEFKFKNTQKIRQDTDKTIVRMNCNSGFWGNQKSYDFMESISMRLEMQSDSFRISYRMNLMSLNFDAVDASVYWNWSCGGNTGWVIFADRGKKDVLAVEEKFRVIPDTVLNKKAFKNILGRRRKDTELCCCGIQPPTDAVNEVFFDRQKGIVGFKTIEGKIWTLDRVE